MKHTWIRQLTSENIRDVGEINYLRLVDALFSHDDLIAVVVGQTYIDYYLLQLVRTGLRAPDALGKRAGGMQFRHLLALAVAMGQIEPIYTKPLDLLSQLRNDLAHTIAHRITHVEVNELHKATLKTPVSPMLRVANAAFEDGDSAEYKTLEMHQKLLRELVWVLALAVGFPDVAHGNVV